MKSVPSRLMKIITHCLTIGLFLLVISGVAFAQSAQDMFKGAVKEGAREMLGVNKPIEGQAEMMDGAKMMMQGRRTLRDELIRSGKLRDEEGLSGGRLMTDGNDAVADGDKLIRSDQTQTAQGKKKMLDGAKMMADAKKMMMDDLSRKGILGKAGPSEGETMMNDGERMLKKGEMMMLK
ncbi:MAG: hypothetical protein ABFD97_01475 [Syntrophobacter sp.]